MKRLIVSLLVFVAFVQTLTAQIQKNTNIQVTILGVPPSETARINSTYPVDASGNIRMWEIGTIRAAGMSSTALAKKIEQAYKAAQIYTTPTINIQTGETEKELQELVTVTGSVRSPGTVNYLRGMTLAQALAAVGGPSAFGTTKRVTVWREGKKYRLSPRTNEQHKLERIFPGDVIEVDQVKAWESGGQ